MKRTALFCLLAAAMLFSCTKENKQDETDEITTPGEPPKEDVIVDVTSIELRKTEVEMDITLTEGKIIEVVSTTPHVEERHLNASIVSGEDVISIERDERGWRVRPLKVGSADVRIVPDHGPAEKHCTVKVSEGNVADAKPVTKLSANKTSFVLKDLIMDGFSYSIDKVTVPFEIEPADAVFGDDIVVTVDREDVLNISFENKEVTIAAKPNMSHKPSETGTFNVYVKPKKGDAKPVTLKVEVTGHVYGVELGVFDTENENWETKGSQKRIVMVTNKSVNLRPRILATDRKTYSVEEYGKFFFSDGKDMVANWKEAGQYGSVSAAGVAEAKSLVTKGVDVYIVAGIKGGNLDLTGYPVDIYSEVTGIDLQSSIPTGTEDAPKVGTNVSVTVNLVSSSDYFRGSYVLDYSTDYLSKVSESDSKVTFKCLKGSMDKVYISAYPTGKKNMSSKVEFYINEYSASDRKPGDYVYWNSSMGFFASDGGLRVLGGDTFRGAKVEPFEKDLIGIIITELTTDEFNVIKNLQPSVSFAGLNGKHFRVLSVRDAGSERWSTSNDDNETIQNIWKNQLGNKYGAAPYNTSRGSYSDEVQVNLGWKAYNEKVSANNRMKAIYPSEVFYSPVGTYVTPGLLIDLTKCSGWLLPLHNNPAKDNAAYNNKWYPIIRSSLSNAGSQAQALNGPYWLASYTEKKNYSGNMVYHAYLAKPTVKSNDNGDGPEVTSSRSSYAQTRPVLYL